MKISSLLRIGTVSGLVLSGSLAFANPAKPACIPHAKVYLNEKYPQCTPAIMKGYLANPHRAERMRSCLNGFAATFVAQTCTPKGEPWIVVDPHCSQPQSHESTQEYIVSPGPIVCWTVVPGNPAENLAHALIVRYLDPTAVAPKY